MLCYISIIHIRSENFLTKTPVLWSALICIVYGATDEFHQYFVPNRSAEVQDWLADIFGAVIAAFIIYYFLKNRYSLFKKEIPNEV